MLLTREELRDLGPGARTGSASGLGNLGVIPIIAAVGSAAGQTAGSYFASEGVKAQAKADVEMYEAQAIAAAAPYRYEYKLGKRVLQPSSYAYSSSYSYIKV